MLYRPPLDIRVSINSVAVGLSTGSSPARRLYLIGSDLILPQHVPSGIKYNTD